MRWPASWARPELLALLEGTAVDCLLDAPAAIAELARGKGLKIGWPQDVRVVKGDWPGVKLTESGRLDHAAAGPTGAPWVDSNGWRIRLEAALHTGSGIWVDAAPQKPRLDPDTYAMAVADAAAHGGRWILSLDDNLAAALADGKPQARAAWEKLTAAARFFAAHREWSDYELQAAFGILSDFAGGNEMMSQELLNLVARTNQQYRVLPKSSVADGSFSGLKALFYTDDEPPAPPLAARILDFVRSGGLLITGPRWGAAPAGTVSAADHPRYDVRSLGSGRIAVHRGEFDDPYLVANDAPALLSHRHELLRFWNAGAIGSTFCAKPPERRAVVQLLFYAFILDDRRPTVRVAGPYRSAHFRDLRNAAPIAPETVAEPGALEIHLPPVGVYAALELTC
jgi:hypothetical protein